MTKKPFHATVEEDLNRLHNVTLTEGQIATILYVMEGYIQGNDDYDEESVFYQDVNNIFKQLEGAVDSFYESQRPDLGEDNTDYAECVDTLVDKLETAKRVAGVEVTDRFLSALDDDPYKNIPNRY